MAEALKLICTLKTHIVGPEGDFIPAGTPVQVIGWDDDGKSIEVRTTAHVYVDAWEGMYEAIEAGASTGCVGSGLYVPVPPDALLYSDDTHMTTLNERKKARREAWAD
ncbi:MAG: hypothetical protein ACO3DQ_07405 [Cephaloticoccus sp.]|jgi:hypothetical protein